MTASVRTALVAGVLVVALAFPPVVASSEPAYVAVTEATVTPGTPGPDRPFTVTATISNQPGSPDALELTSVVLKTRTEDGLVVLDRASDLGVLAPESAIPVPLSGTLADPGTHTLRIEAYGWANGSFVHVGYPVVVQVRDRPTPLLTLDAPEAVAGVETTINATIANRDSAPIRGAVLTVQDRNTNEPLARRVLGRIEADTTHRVSLPVRLTATGPRPIRATLRYLSTSGSERTVATKTTGRALPARSKLELTATALDASEDPTVRVTVENRGNVPVTNISLRTALAGRQPTFRSVPSIPPEDRRTVSVNLSGVPRGRWNATVMARYEAAGSTHVATTTVSGSNRPGRVILTGVTIDRRGGRVTVSGHASNVGLAPVRSVVVRPIRTAAVRPIHPGRAYFVGTVPASDFVPFEVTVHVSANATAVPLRVAGIHDEDPFARIHRIPLETTVEPTTGSDPGSEPIVPAMAGGIVTVGVFGLIAIAWRNSRDGR